MLFILTYGNSKCKNCLSNKVTSSRRTVILTTTQTKINILLRNLVFVLFYVVLQHIFRFLDKFEILDFIHF